MSFDKNVSITNNSKNQYKNIFVGFHNTHIKLDAAQHKQAQKLKMKNRLLNIKANNKSCRKLLNYTNTAQQFVLFNLSNEPLTLGTFSSKCKFQVKLWSGYYVNIQNAEYNFSREK